MEQYFIRNFCVIAHIDHGKSTLADRFLELTNTIPKREMREQVLDQMDIERERGITIKLQPVRMIYKMRTGADFTRTNADLLYEDLTYKVRGAIFKIKKKLGLGHKENIYQGALEEEFKNLNIKFEKEKIIDVIYNDKKVGIYRPDFVIDDKIIIEIKALTFIGGYEEKQVWHYLKGTNYKLALLVNFGLKDVDIKRIIYDTARNKSPQESALSQPESVYILNLIDTPGHVDFTYEVTRSLVAVEGAILLVDATQGVQAQTVANLYLALDQNLTIIPVINKIDLPNVQIEKTQAEICQLLGCQLEEIILISAKTGENVARVLEAVINKTPPPKIEKDLPLRSLIFDSTFDDYKGVIASVRIMEGQAQRGDRIKFMVTKKEVEISEVGYFSPKLKPTESLAAGEIGYIVTGLKNVSECRVGDTLAVLSVSEPLPGYKEIKPMVFAGLFPKIGDQYLQLREAIEKLKLNDAALFFGPENSKALGFGFRCGFLGLLHLEIVQERLRREFGLELVVTVPSVGYKVILKNGKEFAVKSPQDLPDPSQISQILEPIMKVAIFCPKKYLGGVMALSAERRGEYSNTEYLSGNLENSKFKDEENLAVLHYQMPLSTLILDFYDKLKGLSSGYASLNYEFFEYRPAKIIKLDILVAEEPVEALAALVYEDEAHRIGRRIVESLKENLPRQMFVVKLQAAVGGKVIAAERLSALRKDVTAKLYGGDYTRKRKLLEKQKKGKKKMMVHGKGRVDIPPQTYLAVLKR